MRAPGLPQSEKAGDENHYDNNTNYVENTVHVSFSFLRVIGFTVEPDAHNMTQRKGMREASLIVLPPDDAQWESQVQ